MKQKKYNRSYSVIAIVVILLIGFSLRTFGLNWDQGFYLHPDERFLAMVTAALRLPISLSTYFDPAVSPLNPYNNNFAFFVYGKFPIILVRVLMELFQLTSYFDVRFIGRMISALADTSVIGAMYLIAKRLLKAQSLQSRFPLYAALSYAVFVFPIQQAHFFTTDSIVNTFFVWAVYFALLANPLLTGIMIGLGIASKISFTYTLPLLVGLLVISKLHPPAGGTNHKQFPNYKSQLAKTLFYLFLMTLVSYITLRIADPYLFQTNNWFDFHISKQFLSNLDQLKALASLKTFYPPSVQWLSKDGLFPLRNIILFGIGPVFTVLSLLGIAKLFLCHCELLCHPGLDPGSSFNKILKRVQDDKRIIVVSLILFWSLSFFFYQSFQFAKTMRYFLFLYPFLALLAGYFLSSISHRTVRTLLFLSAFVWTISFMHIYTVPHSRIQASKWMYNNIPNQKTIAWEYWDDPLPLVVSRNKKFIQLPLDMYQLPDSKEKWKLITKKLQYVDYISLSSNRLYGSIPRVPELYPLASKYYADLFAEKLRFQKVAEFTSYPALLFGPWKIEMNDDNSEEAFTVYDHPVVTIFKKV